MMTLPCRYGVIYPRGGSLLCLEIRRGPVANRIRELFPDIRVPQDGDRELTLVFDESNCEEIMKIVRPRKRRKLSPEHKAALLSAGHRFEFKRGTQNDSSTRQTQTTTTADPNVSPCGALA